MRQTQDFLEYCKGDIHYFSITIVQLLLYLSVYRFGKKNIYDIAPALNIIAGLLLLNIVVIYKVFFVNEKSFDIDKTVTFVKICLVINVVLNTAAFALFNFSEKDFYSPYEDTFIIENVIMNYTMCVYIASQYITWPNQKKHYMLERFIKEAESEEKLLESLS